MIILGIRSSVKRKLALLHFGLLNRIIKSISNCAAIHKKESHMKYGYFDDKQREYVIETPETPLPWINYLGSNGFFGLISNTAGGYCFYRDAKLRRITRYRYNNVPVDEGGRMFYINDAGTVWSPAFRPSRTPLDSYECRHGMGYTTFEGTKNGLRAKLTCFVPIGDACEIERLVISNE